MVLTWDLSTVLRALRGPPFKPLELADLRELLLKMTLLLALALVKRDGDLQVLSASASCLEFGLNDLVFRLLWRLHQKAAFDKAKTVLLDSG